MTVAAPAFFSGSPTTADKMFSMLLASTLDCWRNKMQTIKAAHSNPAECIRNE